MQNTYILQIHLHWLVIRHHVVLLLQIMFWIWAKAPNASCAIYIYIYIYIRLPVPPFRQTFEGHVIATAAGLMHISTCSPTQ